MSNESLSSIKQLLLYTIEGKIAWKHLTQDREQYVAQSKEQIITVHKEGKLYHLRMFSDDGVDLTLNSTEEISMLDASYRKMEELHGKIQEQLAHHKAEEKTDENNARSQDLNH